MKFQFCEINSAHRMEKFAKFNKINDFFNSANRRIGRPTKFNAGAILRTPYIRDTHPLQIGRVVGYQEGERSDTSYPKKDGRRYKAGETRMSKVKYLSLPPTKGKTA